MEHHKITLVAIFFLGAISCAFSQNSMGIGTTTPNPNAVLELVSPGNNQGILVPRLTSAQRSAMSLTAPDNGMLVFDTDSARFYFWVDPAWMEVSNKAGGTAGDVAVTPTGNLVSADVQSALVELQTKLDTTKYSPWKTSGSNLLYDSGYVGIQTANPLSPLQVGDQLSFFHFENSGFPVEGEVIADNLHAVGDALFFMEDGPSAFIFFDSGSIEFLHSEFYSAGTDALAVDAVSTSLRLNKSRDAEFQGAVTINSLQDTANIRTGTMQFDSGYFLGFNGSEWISLGGLSFPSSNYISDGGANPFFIENNGGGGVARFVVNNPTASGNVLDLYSNSDDLSTNVLDAEQGGLGGSAQFNINNAGNTNNALSASTTGSGSAGYFSINNASSPAAGVMGIVDAGTGSAIEGRTNGDGPAGRFEILNTANTSVALVVSNSGTNGAATFTNSNASSVAAVEILNNGTGAGLTIQNPGGTTSFGDVTRLGGGHVNNVRTLAGTETLLATDYAILIGGGGVTATIPDGLPVGTTYIITIGESISGGAVAFVTENLIGNSQNSIPMSSDAGTIRTVTLMKVDAGNWALIAQINNP